MPTAESLAMPASVSIFAVGREVGEHRLERGLGLAEIAGMHRERMAGEAVVRDVGDDHVEVDLRLGEGAEDLAGHAGFVGDAGEGDARLRAFDRDAADDDVFHVGMFF